MIITIDGPSGTGKTTIAKAVAKRLDFDYFDTGSTYRAITLFFITHSVDPDDLPSVEKYLKEFSIVCKHHGNERHYYVGDEDVTTAIRSQEITKRVSKIAALRPVREVVWKMQRDSAKNTDAVFEGRDMGSVVFPQAELKIFLTAHPEIRAERRLKELEGKEEFRGVDHGQILEDIMRRDQHDSTRELAPLKQAEDAHLVDTSNLTIDEVVEEILKLVKT